MHEATTADHPAHTADPRATATPNDAGSLVAWLQSHPIVAGVAAIAAVVAAMSDAAPTGTTAWDVVLKAVLAAAFVVAVSVSPTWVAITVATVAAAFIGDSAWLGAAAFGLFAAVGAAVFPQHERALATVSAGFAIQVLLRLSDVGFFGLPSLLAGAAILLALAYGYQVAGPRVRRTVHLTTAAAGVLAGIFCLVGGLVLLSARSDVENGINAARAGLSAARGGDPEAVVAELEEAAASLSAAEDRSNSLLAQPLRLVPIAAQHRHAITTATRQGSQIATQASKATIDADVSSITMSAGAVDLSALAAMETDLVQTADLLESGIAELDDARSPWLIPQIADRMDSLTDEMRDVLPEARVAADAARVVPGLLGQDEPRRYFVAFGSPAESRALGGFIGTWALLEFDAGRVSQIDAGRISDLYDLVREPRDLTIDAYPFWYFTRSRPHFWPQNLGASPRLSVVTLAASELFDGIGGGSIDGFVYLDTYVLGSLLEITGPITIDGVDHPIDAANANDFFFDEQYRLADRDEIKDELGAAFTQVFEGLLDKQLPGPERLGEILGPVARQGRLQVATFDDDENAFLQSIKLQRDFLVPGATADSFAIVQNMGSPSKLDLYLHRDISYEAKVDDDGTLAASVVVELTSDVPADAPAYALGRDDPGRHELYVSLYTPHELSAVGIDGDEVAFDETLEFGYNRYEVRVEMRAGSGATIEFELAGEVDPDRSYDVAVWQQPLVNNDTVRLTYRDGDGNEANRSFELVENTVIPFPE